MKASIFQKLVELILGESTKYRHTIRVPFRTGARIVMINSRPAARYGKLAQQPLGVAHDVVLG